jgi:hypothetical protein
LDWFWTGFANAEFRIQISKNDGGSRMRSRNPARHIAGEKDDTGK